MNQKIPVLTRSMVYAFLVGLFVGGIAMALIDSYANKPLFSSAFAPGDDTRYCGDEYGTLCENPYRFWNRWSGGGTNTGGTNTSVKVLNDGEGDYGTVLDEDGTVISPGSSPGERVR